jgi:exopolyphosphatase/guanosine-5'-triphosphate,3'-diphosphate pyrophosphatase
LGKTGLLSPEGCLSAYQAIRDYQHIAEAQNVSALRVVATAAVRDAHDGNVFVTTVQELTGIDIRILNGHEEACYAAEGVLALDAHACGVVADFGGGSLELALVHHNKIFDTASLPIGALRVQSMGDEAEETIRTFLQEHRAMFFGQPSLYAIGGSWRALAQAYMMKIGASHEMQSYAIPMGDLVGFCERVEAMSVEDIQLQYQLEGYRAVLAPIAAKVLRVVVQTLNPELFVTSAAGVRDGIVHEYLLSKVKKA